MGWICSAAYCYSISPQNHFTKLLSLSWPGNHHHHHHQNPHARVKMMRSAATPTCTPWLMLPPAVEEGGEFSYKFFSLEEEKVLTFRKRGRGDEIPPDDAKVVGSSYGWVASFDENSNHVFLSDPISDRHVKLPSIDTLPDPHINLFEGRGLVSQVCISGPPPLDQEKENEWGAMMTFGPGIRPAGCSWGPGATWEHLEVAFQAYKPHKEEHVKFAMRPHHDLVHGGRGGGGGYFTTIQPCSFYLRCGSFVRDKYGGGEKHCEMLHWSGGYCVRETPITSLEVRGVMWEEEMNVDVDMLEKECIQMPHLVWVETICDTNPLIVMRFLKRGTGRTVFFLVLRIVKHQCEVVDCLNGSVLFVGMNQAVAFPATGKLKPNSIYFTDSGRVIGPPDTSRGDRGVGIFEFSTKTISQCNYDFHNNIHRPPIWFTPN